MMHNARFHVQDLRTQEKQLRKRGVRFFFATHTPHVSSNRHGPEICHLGPAASKKKKCFALSYDALSKPERKNNPRIMYDVQKWTFMVCTVVSVFSCFIVDLQKRKRRRPLWHIHMSFFFAFLLENPKFFLT